MPPVRPDGAAAVRPGALVPARPARPFRTPPAIVAPTSAGAVRLNGRPVNGHPRRPLIRGRVSTDGKFFSCAGQRFPFHGVSYGTFAPRDSDGARFPETRSLLADVQAIAAAGFTVLRTYTSPPDDLLDACREHGLHVLAGVYYDDWRAIVGAGRRARGAMARAAETTMRAEAARLAGRDEVLAVVVGNEVPADAVRWFGARHVEAVLDRLVAVVHDADPELLATYASYPTSEYVDVDGVDFLTFNVFLERQDDLRRYITRLHHLAGDRPLVLGELGLHAGDDDEGEARQADAIDWQLATALERGVGGTCVFSWTDEWSVGGNQVEGWRFGLTRRDRSPRPALLETAAWNHRTVADLDYPWPSISVVVCAYNAAETLDECLRATTQLDYPELEIIVVDDGSTDATAGIAYRHSRVRLVSIEHAGLSAARNAGIRHATGDLVAYLDSDAYPTPEWPYYLALGMDGPKVGGVGGPNVPPRDDPPGAHRVAASPGGPVHVLVTNDRAEHVPGCNMAFWHFVLTEVGGFDPVYTAAGDDVDVCWKVLDRGWEIGFHPAALVWHHRRPTVQAYLRQQRGYGKAEALVAARHPDRFTGTGTARWRGRIYTSVARSFRHQRIYRGAFAGAAFQSVYGAGGHTVDLAHQVGIPAALGVAAAALAVGVLAWSPALLVAAACLALVLGLATYDGWTAPPPVTGSRVAHRATVGLLHVLQPLARWWGRWRHRTAAHQDIRRREPVGPASTAGRGTLTFTATGARPEMTADIIGRLRRNGVVVLPVTGWEDHDGRVAGSALVTGELVTSAHTDGIVQLRVRHRLRWLLAGPLAALAVMFAVIEPVVAVAIAVLAVLDVAWGVQRTGRRVRQILRREP